MDCFKKNYESIRENREFQLLFRKAESYVTHGFVCYYLKRRQSNSHVNGIEVSPCNRLGIVASKKVGNAVKRNRAKRVIREAFRIAEAQLRKKTDNRYDFVFVARGKTPCLKSTEIYELIVKGLFKKLLT